MNDLVKIGPSPSTIITTISNSKNDFKLLKGTILVVDDNSHNLMVTE